MDQQTRHNRFERLANSDVVKQERKGITGWVSIDPQTGERTDWAQQLNKDGIKTVNWTKDNEIESIETEDGQTVYPSSAPSTWEYLAIPLFLLLGFFIPWSAVRAAGWVAAGFVKGST